jgi:transposase
VSDDQLEPYVEGTIVDDTPFTEVHEAEQFMATTLEYLRRGVEMQEKAEYLLDVGKRRRIWEILGFDSWDECLMHGVAETFKVSMHQAARLPVVISLRNQGLHTDGIAKAVGMSDNTVRRDLRKAREDGQLRDEPAKVAGLDGRSRPVVNQRTERAQRPERRRPFPDYYRGIVDRAVALTTSLQNARADDRWELHDLDLAGRHIGDL